MEAVKAHPKRKVDDLIRQTYFDRFLCRVFSDGEDSGWVLKGGSGMLARLPNARRTLDVDLYRVGYTKDQGLAELKRLATIDLGDFFRFAYSSHAAILAGEAQPYADGYTVIFEIIALTQSIDAQLTAAAIRSEFGKRRLDVPQQFAIPDTWGMNYAKLSRNTPAAGHSISDAVVLMASFIDPLMGGFRQRRNLGPGDPHLE
ncbi:MAG: hypothetical protein LBQ06_06385 [Frankiaceae bacterium]|nr:hypothetical protein [Frankiaceae bacterium]